MAKQKGIIKISGKDKSSDRVFVHSKYGEYARALPKAGSKKDEPALKAQNVRNKYLNPLASKVSNCMKQHAGLFADSGLYHAILSRFRKEPSAVRVLLLEELKDLEINPKYPFSVIYAQNIVEVVTTKKRITVKLSLEHHAYSTKRCNSYYLEAIVVCWNNADDNCVHQSKKTVWIRMNEELPLYCDLVFDQAGNATDHLVALRCVRGVNNHDDELFPMQGMKVVEVGSLDKKMEALLDGKRTEKLAERSMRMKKEEAVKEERVEMRKGRR